MLCALSVEVTGVATEKRQLRSSSKAAEWRLLRAVVEKQVAFVEFCTNLECFCMKVLYQTKRFIYFCENKLTIYI